MSENCPHVLIGITGCVAAYKSCEIVRGLQKEGIDVKVVMTEHAEHFIGTATLRALTHRPVAVKLFDESADPVHHISLARDCDVFLIAPATANVIAKIAHGIADDLLTTTALSTTSPIIMAPAMNTAMYNAAATQENLATLKERGVVVIEPDEGYLACGEVGQGRLADTDDIVARTIEVLHSVGSAEKSSAVGVTEVVDAAGYTEDFAGKRIVITAGPTIEPIDSVRYLSNYSSGKMGYAIAQAAACRGAIVDLITGPVAVTPPEHVHVIPVTTAREMLECARDAFQSADVAICAAAVVDMRPENTYSHKLKKGVDSDALSNISLVENPDILATLASDKKPGQYVVGFAAETDDVVDNAQEKLTSKNVDMIIANEAGNGKGFNADTIKAWIIDTTGTDECDEMSKADFANFLLDRIKEKL